MKCYTFDGYSVREINDVPVNNYGLFNNEIVSYKLYNHQQTSLVIDTLEEALPLLFTPTKVVVYLVCIIISLQFKIGGIPIHQVQFDEQYQRNPKVNEYLHYYNEKRILEKLGHLTPKDYGAIAA